ncbi:MAG: hypothetical protein KI785_12615 [Devosiaceae bacterium]|nr:hypothetical protein [Devosiaceae bacterium MH13]
MFLGYIGAIAGGIGLAALLLVVSKLFRLKLPRWAYPAAAGLGMIGLTINVEYAWYNETASKLPPEVEVVQTFTTQAPYQPWTYVVPRINRLVAVDHSSALTRPDVENVVFVVVYLAERLTGTLLAEMFINCETGERTRTGEDLVQDERGLPPEDSWIMVGTDHPIVSAVCERQGLPIDPQAAAQG